MNTYLLIHVLIWLGILAWWIPRSYRNKGIVYDLLKGLPKFLKSNPIYQIWGFLVLGFLAVLIIRGCT